MTALMSSPPPTPRIGVDTGGTFTDLVVIADGVVRVEKVLSTLGAPEKAIVAGLELLDGDGDATTVTEVVHGSTVGLNALLTGNAGRVALVTNEGFLDLIEIRRQDRPDLYALHPVVPEPLVARADRHQVSQRSWPDLDGNIIEVSSPSKTELSKLAKRIRRSGVDTVCVCLLHAYGDPAIEEQVARPLREAGLNVTTSAALLNTHREYERMSTALINACLTPVMGRYIERLHAVLGKRRLALLQSSGGTISAELAAEQPARVVLSGPAGGVVGAARAAAEAELGPVVTLDLGGTSTDVAFHDPGAGRAGATSGSSVAGHALALPSLDVHCIGCGGGSLVRLDNTGVLQVGPQSAGADPGPIAYGRGSEPTLTDALLFTGRIDAGRFLKGQLELDHEGVRRAFEKLGDALGVTAMGAARGSLQVARAAMRRALTVMTMQRGKDPAMVSLVAFGGGGGLFGVELAQDLGMLRVLVPAHAGVLSAWGMVHADATLDRAQTVLEPLAKWSKAKRARAFKQLEQQSLQHFVAAGHRHKDCQYERVLELRFCGQSHELAIPEGTDPSAEFLAAHEQRYGWNPPTGEIELVHLASRAIVPGPDADTGRKPRRKKLSPAAEVAKRKVDGERARVPVLDRNQLQPGMEFAGPCLVEESTTTTWLPRNWQGRVTRGGHLLLEPR